jgi:hypothetical protein
MKNVAFVLIAGLLTASALMAGDWTPVFNQKDITGWTVRGDAEVKVVDGVLVGTQKTVKGGDLLTDAEYDNFELRFSYKVVWPANSGVWFRFDGEKGYQFDILKWEKPVGFSGTLYFPGKMFLATNPDESLENRDDWNDGRIYANGDHIILWLNGHQVGEARDTTHAKGKIGIQIHGGDKFSNMAIHIRKMEIRTLKPGDPPGREDP